MNCLENQRLCLMQGQAIELEIPVVNCAGEPADLTAAAVEFGIAPNHAAPYTVTPAARIEGSTVFVALTSAETAALDAGPLYFSAWVTIAGQSTPIARGVLTVRRDSRSASP